MAAEASLDVRGLSLVEVGPSQGAEELESNRLVRIERRRGIGSEVHRRVGGRMFQRRRELTTGVRHWLRVQPMVRCGSSPQAPRSSVTPLAEHRVQKDRLIPSPQSHGSGEGPLRRTCAPGGITCSEKHDARRSSPSSGVVKPQRSQRVLSSNVGSSRTPRCVRRTRTAQIRNCPSRFIR